MADPTLEQFRRARAALNKARIPDGIHTWFLANGSTVTFTLKGSRVEKILHWDIPSFNQESSMEQQIYALDLLADEVHQNAVAHGWWEGERNDGEVIALIHSEASEALEALRHGNPASDHIPEFSALEEELADIVIRVMDYAAGKGLRLGAAFAAKHEFNKSRPFKHGGKTF